MPGMDGTGPRGLGPMTGGGRGWCNPNYVGVRSPVGEGRPYSQPHGDGVFNILLWGALLLSLAVLEVLGGVSEKEEGGGKKI